MLYSLPLFGLVASFTKAPYQFTQIVSWHKRCYPYVCFRLSNNNCCYLSQPQTPLHAYRVLRILVIYMYICMENHMIGYEAVSVLFSNSFFIYYYHLHLFVIMICPFLSHTDFTECVIECVWVCVFAWPFYLDGFLFFHANFDMFCFRQAN